MAGIVKAATWCRNRGDLTLAVQGRTRPIGARMASLQISAGVTCVSPTADVGVLLRDDVDEAALAAAMDTYGATFTGRTDPHPWRSTRSDTPVPDRSATRGAASP